MAGPEQSIPHENLEEYFEELRNPLFENTIRRFFTDVSEDCNWCLIEAPKEGTPTSRDMYAKRFQDASKFVFELLSAFGISPVCNVCPGQDGRAGYVLHVCGVNHFKYLAEKLSKDRVRCKDSKELQRQYEHSWTFVLGQVIINYLTGEVRVKRRPSFIGIQVRKAQDLPTTGRAVSKLWLGMDMDGLTESSVVSSVRTGRLITRVFITTITKWSHLSSVLNSPLYTCLVLGWHKFHLVVRLSLGFVSSAKGLTQTQSPANSITMNSLFQSFGRDLNFLIILD